MTIIAYILAIPIYWLVEYAVRKAGYPKKKSYPSFFVQLIWALAAIRFISRAFEISYAFGGDVIARPRNKSGLSKYSRIQLAFRSYIELFLLSIPVYYAHCLADGRLESVTLSLSVGTLTNVGYAFSKEHVLETTFIFFVFLQVFATLSLVILSLAIYISRRN